MVYPEKNIIYINCIRCKRIILDQQNNRGVASEGINYGYKEKTPAHDERD